MEIKKIKIAGCESDMIFTGGKYIFYNDWYGVVGVATRKGYNCEDKHSFVIKAGADVCSGRKFLVAPHQETRLWSFSRRRKRIPVPT